MKTVLKQYKTFTEKEREQHSRLYDELGDIQDRVARYVIAGEIVRNMRNIDDYIGV